MQVEHLTRTMRLNLMRGGQALRLQHAEAISRLNTSLQSYGGASASARLETAERQLNISRNITRWSEPRGGYSVRNKRPAELQHQECRQQPIFKKKNASDLGKPNTGNEPTALHRLQYRERQHAMPTRQGGAIGTHYEQCA